MLFYIQFKSCKTTSEVSFYVQFETLVMHTTSRKIYFFHYFSIAFFQFSQKKPTIFNLIFRKRISNSWIYFNLSCSTRKQFPAITSPQHLVCVRKKKSLSIYSYYYCSESFYVSSRRRRLRFARRRTVYDRLLPNQTRFTTTSFPERNVLY